MKAKTFTGNCESHLRSIGALDVSGLPGYLGYRFALPTRYGTLLITPYDNWVACRFSHVELAVAGNIPNVNPHSGKWNWHFSGQTKRELLAQAAPYFAHQLEGVMQ